MNSRTRGDILLASCQAPCRNPPLECSPFWNTLVGARHVFAQSHPRQWVDVSSAAYKTS